MSTFSPRTNVYLKFKIRVNTSASGQDGETGARLTLPLEALKQWTELMK